MSLIDGLSHLEPLLRAKAQLSVVQEMAASIMADLDTTIEAEISKGRTLSETDAVRAKYDELIYAVSIKREGETRHETALRYIKTAEYRSSDQAKAASHSQESAK